MNDALSRLQGAIADRYGIEREIGRGGMAVVYLGRDAKHDRRVAIKVLKPELAAALGPDRFLREIRLTASLQHPHILPLLDSGEADGQLYYVMPYVEGESVRERLAREKQLPVEDALAIAGEVADALDHAHRQGIVHRDIKPENVLLQAGHAVVSDFGIARALTLAGAERLTETGIAVGTPAYMSPEQAAGEAVESRSDIYSLGCVTYEMLAGEPPFTGPTAQAIAARRLSEAVPSLRTVRETVPEPVEQVILRALSKVPADRPATAREFGKALARASAAAPVAPVAAGLGARARRWGTVAAVVAVALATWWAVRAFGPRTPGGARSASSLAVLPLDNLAGDPEQEYFVDGMTEALITDVSKIRSLRVISRRSVMQYKAARKPLREIARELHADFVLEGSVARVGERVRVTAQLIEAARDRHVWAERYERDLSDVLALQGEVAQAIARAVRVQLTPQERERLAARRPIQPAAHEAYLLGRHFWNKRTPEGLTKAFEHFQQAMALDPGYAAPHAGVAEYYNVLPFYSRHSPGEVFPQAKSAALKAIELDETVPEAHAALAFATAYYDWDWQGAEREFGRALELNPSYASVHHSYSRLLAAMGRIEEALAEIRRAEELDPIPRLLKANTAMILYFGRRYDEAIAQLRRTLVLDSSFAVAHWGLGLCYEQQGRSAQAIAAIEKAMAVSERDPNFLGSLGHVLARSGRRREAERLMAELRAQSGEGYVSGYHTALILAGLGRQDEAIAWLRRAAEERSTLLVYLRADPRLAELHGAAGFQDLLRRLGLP